MTLDKTLAVLLGPVPAPLPIEAIEDLDRRSDGIESGPDSTVERALLGGFSADRIGVAFAFGYRAALTQLVPNVAKRACLAATEAGGAHPRAIRTTLREEAGAFVLDGTKSWVTLGTAAEEILVVATTGEVDGKNRLRVVRLPAARKGVTLVAREPAPFAPEIPHSEARFQNVHVAPNEVLPGDGYERYLKPFRTIEDLHVLAGFTGYLVSLARRGQWGNPAVEELIAFALALRGAEPLDPSSSATHVALAGLFARVRGFLAATEVVTAIGKLDPAERDRFERDRPLLMVAERARGMRLEAAWKRLSAE